MSFPRKQFTVSFPRKQFTVSFPRKQFTVSFPRKQFTVSFPRKQFTVSFPRKRESTMETYYVYILPSPKRRTLYIEPTNDQEVCTNTRIEKSIADGGIPIMTWERVDSRFRGNDTISNGNDKCPSLPRE